MERERTIFWDDPKLNMRNAALNKVSPHRRAPHRMGEKWPLATLARVIPGYLMLLVANH